MTMPTFADRAYRCNDHITEARCGTVNCVLNFPNVFVLA